MLLSPILGHHRQPAEAVFLKLGFRGHLESRIGHVGALRRERRFRGARLGPVVFLGLGGVGEPLSEKEQDVSDGLPAQYAPVPGSGDLLAIVHFREIPLKDAGHLVGDDQRGGAALFSFSSLLYRESTDTVSNRQRWTGGRGPGASMMCG